MAILRTSLVSQLPKSHARHGRTATRLDRSPLHARHHGLPPSGLTAHEDASSPLRVRHHGLPLFVPTTHKDGPSPPHEKALAPISSHGEARAASLPHEHYLFGFWIALSRIQLAVPTHSWPLALFPFTGFCIGALAGKEIVCDAQNYYSCNTTYCAPDYCGWAVRFVRHSGVWQNWRRGFGRRRGLGWRSGVWCGLQEQTLDTLIAPR